jgi:hypothetical protein
MAEAELEPLTMQIVVRKDLLDVRYDKKFNLSVQHIELTNLLKCRLKGGVLVHCWPKQLM